MDEVLPDVPLELILNVTIKQDAGKSSVAITANVDLSYHLYYAEGVYNPEKRILIQNDVTMSYMDASEEMRSAVTAQIEELLEKTQRIDEKRWISASRSFRSSRRDKLRHGTTVRYMMCWDAETG